MHPQVGTLCEREHALEERELALKTIRSKSIHSYINAQPEQEVGFVLSMHAGPFSAKDPPEKVSSARCNSDDDAVIDEIAAAIPVPRETPSEALEFDLVANSVAEVEVMHSQPVLRKSARLAARAARGVQDKMTDSGPGKRVGRCPLAVVPSARSNSRPKMDQQEYKEKMSVKAGRSRTSKRFHQSGSGKKPAGEIDKENHKAVEV